jgi:hypothetical protein
MNRLYSLISIGMLAASASSLPQQLDKLITESAQLKAYSASADTIDAAADAARLGLPNAAVGGGLSAEQRQLIAEASPESMVMSSPMMTAMVRAAQGGGGMPEINAKRTVLAGYRAYQQNQAAILGLMWAGPALLVFLAGVMLVVGAKGVARFLAQLCFSMSSKWLFIFSVSAAALYAAAHVNLWTSLPHDLWAVPITALLVAGGILRVADLNYPVWNTTTGALISPLLSCLFIVGCGRFGLFR